jgi:hypothetical protein
MEETNSQQDQFLAQEELALIREQKTRLQMIDLQKQNAELELRVTILKIYLKYKLDDKDVIDEATGKLIRR